MLVKDGAAAAMSVAAATAAAEKLISNETADECGGRQRGLTPECRPGVALLYYCINEGVINILQMSMNI